MMLFFEIFVNFWKFLKSFPHNIWSSRVINVCDFCYQWLVSVLMLWIPFTVCHSVSDSIIQQHINQPTSESVPTTKALIRQWSQRFKDIHVLPSNDRSVVCPGKCGFCVVPSSSCCTAWNALFSLSAFFLSSVISWLPWRSSLQFFSSVVRQFTIYKC